MSDPKLASEMSEKLSKIDELPSPRLIMSHLPFYLLHPDLLDTSKVHLVIL